MLKMQSRGIMREPPEEEVKIGSHCQIRDEMKSRF